MAIFKDGQKTAEITMNVWNGRKFSNDFSADFFEARRDVDGLYMVDNIDDCIDLALDWRYGIGEMRGKKYNPNERLLTVNGFNR